jgi:16S rRNA (uracil1498-N3)-methyltransferase
MRAIFKKEKLSIGERFIVSDEQFHHLKVVRAKVGDEIKILNGQGEIGLGIIDEITKKETSVTINSIKREDRFHKISLALCLPKKDAFEEIIKIATELGVYKIYPLTSEHSQFNYRPYDRLDRIIESALIQSNNSYWPMIEEERGLKDFLPNSPVNFICFSSVSSSSLDKIKQPSEEIIILIGPEAGFSEKEEAILQSIPDRIIVRLNSPILRATTAVPTAFGYLLSQF